MESWLHTLTTGFGFPEAVAQIFFHLFQSTPFVPHASCQLFLGTIDSTPVGTSLLFLDGQMAGIYAVATIPSQRRCGVGTQMTRIAVEKARQLGYTYVTLQATQMGESIYRHLGFLPVCSFQTYRWTPKHSG
jgi:ribosomal protein S18 acetylase RimI-like enzyme